MSLPRKSDAASRAGNPMTRTWLTRSTHGRSGAGMVHFLPCYFVQYIL